MAKKKPTSKPAARPAARTTKPAPEAKPAPAAKPPSVAAPTNPAETAAGANRRAALRAQYEAEARRARRNRLLVVIGAILAVALVVSAILLLANRRPGTPTPSVTSEQLTPPDGNSKDAGQQAWITVPSTNTKADAPIVDIVTDYQCPYCALFENTYAQALDALSDRGDIVLRQHALTFLDGVQDEKLTSSTRAAVAAACVDIADNTKYAAYSNTIFRNQPPEGTGFTDQQLTVNFTAAVGLTGDALTTFNTCYSTRQTQSWVQNVANNNHEAVANSNPPHKYLYGSDTEIYYDASGQVVADATKGTQGGVHNTPTFFVNGKQFTLNELFTSDNTSITPQVATDADSFLQFLQYIISN